MNNKLIKKSVPDNNQQEDITKVINVGNNEVVEIFGINNENIDYFQKLLSIKVFQKGNQLSLKGSRKNVNIKTKLTNNISLSLPIISSNIEVIFNFKI